MNWVVGVVVGAALVLVATVGRMVEVTFLRLSRARAAGLDGTNGGTSVDRSIALLVTDREAIVGPAAVLHFVAEVALVVGTVAQLQGQPWWVVLLGVGAVGMVLYVCEHAVARRWAIEQNDAMARLLAPVARALQRVPLLRLPARLLAAVARWFGPKASATADSEVAEPELVAMASLAAADQVIEHSEADLIGSIIMLGDTLVRTVMVPRTDMVTVGDATTVSDALAVAVETGFSRIPVVGEGPDDVLGIVHTKDLLRAHLEGSTTQPCAELSREAKFVPETKRAAEMMRDMQSSSSHMAICVDEYGGIAGLVTLEDLIEELVGEIVDEFDSEESLIEQLADDRWRVSGRLVASELTELVGLELPEGDWDTVGGLVLDVAGHVPVPGEAVDVGGHRLTALEVDGRRIQLVEVLRLEEEPAAQVEAVK